MKGLELYFSIAQAIAELLHPHAEIVIHDLKTQTIAAIFNNLSKRKKGDASLLEEMGEMESFPDVFPPYSKTNWDGREMKSVTALIRDSKGAPIGLFCINLDISQWKVMHNFVESWLKGFSEKPEVLFKEDWREKVNQYVTDYLRAEGCTLKSLTKEKKQELIAALHREGAFKAKHAAEYVADVLNLSRATIYNYLRNV